MNMPLNKDNPLTPLFKKQKATIVITDSGLGGLSICAGIADRLKIDPIFQDATIIYYNAWPEQDRGYNRLKDDAERIRVFDRAMTGMERFDPDFIMIACNTLSVLYDRTEFSRRTRIPVIDIVRFGVDMIHERLSGDASGQAVIMGTLTTIASRVHSDLLVKEGVAPDRIVSQPCDQLATEIEKDSHGDAVVTLVERFMKEASEAVDPKIKTIYASLCCTHFGYCAAMIREKLGECTGKDVVILNPNRQMAAYLFALAGGTRYKKTSVALRVVSRIVWEDRKIGSISRLIGPISEETKDALVNYEWIPELFTF